MAALSAYSLPLGNNKVQFHPNIFATASKENIPRALDGLPDESMNAASSSFYNSDDPSLKGSSKPPVKRFSNDSCNSMNGESIPIQRINERNSCGKNDSGASLFSKEHVSNTFIKSH